MLYKATQKLATVFLFVDGVNDDAGVEKESGHLAGSYFLEAALSFLANFFDPLGRALLKLGMILVLPGSGYRV